MSDALSPKARAFLRSVERADEPTDADFDRVRAGVMKHLVAGIATEAPPTAAAANAAGAALVTKIVAAVLVVGGVALGTTGAVRHLRAKDRSKVTVVDAPASSGSADPVRARPSWIAPTASAAEALEPAAVAEPAPVRTPARAPPSATTNPARLSPLDAEIRILRDVRSRLQAGDAPRALTLLDQHDKLYPAGALGEDAAVERIYALCALGEASQARALTARFFAAHPSSPYAAEVRASCGAD
jgi:hypothetical protein